MPAFSVADVPQMRVVSLMGLKDAGVELTTIVRVAVALEHPPAPVTVYVIVAVPADKPAITPVLALIDATDGADETQDPPDIVDVNTEALPTQIAWVPLNVPATGAAVTVTVRVAVALEHPPAPETV